MKRKKDIKKMFIFALIFGLLSLTVAYATLSSELFINSNVHIDDASWKVYFTNLEENSVEGTALIKKNAIIDDENPTKIKDFKVWFSNKNDSISYTFDIKNEGSIDAKVFSVYNSTPICTSLINVQSDADLVCNNISYSLFYTYTNLPVMKDDELLSGETVSVTYKLTYTGNDVPTDDVAIKNLNLIINYIQK